MTDDYRQQAYEWAGRGREQMVDAIAAKLHYNESLHLHDNIDGKCCAYCWLRAGKAVLALADAGLLDAPMYAWIYVDGDDEIPSPHDYATRDVAQAHAEQAWRAAMKGEEWENAPLAWRRAAYDTAISDADATDFDMVDGDGDRLFWQVRRVTIVSEMPQAQAVGSDG